ncbi:DUF397 domain-containing protein [Amycolatopsis sp. NPDC051373]|uniref:DUF397 domain-containing protein n=1 Tax=Amycolatopsis sp. NPDC051373 TaxID=3155801 RepID=UPI00344C3FB1
MNEGAWRTSSYSGNQGECVEVRTLVWRTSSYSGSQGECVEVSTLSEQAGVRDSKDRDGGILLLGGEAWRAFLERL